MTDEFKELTEFSSEPSSEGRVNVEPAFFLPANLKQFFLNHPISSLLTHEVDAETRDRIPLRGYLLPHRDVMVQDFLEEMASQPSPKGADMPSPFVQSLLWEDVIERNLRLLSTDGELLFAGNRACVLLQHQGASHVDFESWGAGVKGARFLPLFSSIFARLGKLIGRRIHLFLGKDEDGIPPWEVDSKTLFVVLGGAPPGEVIELKREMICGKMINPGYTVRSIGNVCGYGTVVEDEDNVVVGQIIDETFYIFLPLKELALSDKDIGSLLIDMFALMWKKFLSDERDQYFDEPVKDANHYARIRLSHFNSSRRKTRESLEDAEEKLRVASEKYLAAARAVHNWRLTLKVVEASALDASFEAKARTDWQTITLIPEVKEVRLIDDGIMVFTNELVIEHEGERYRIGEFAFRFNSSGSLFIWCVKPLHPRRFEHPHSAKFDEICRGNIRTTVRNAYVEGRYGEAVRMLVQLLTEGYDETHAITPVTEWPKFTEEAA